jgi:O-antigen ligase
MFLPTGPKTSSNYLYIIFLLSMCLLPFSTGGGTGTGSVVVTFALPFLLFLFTAIIYIFFNTKGSISYPRELKFSIFCGMIHTFCILLASLMNAELPVAFARSIFHLFGFTIFLYITANSSVVKNAEVAYNKISAMLVLSGFIMAAYFIGNFVFMLQQNSLEQVLLERSKGGLLALPWGVSNTIAACLTMPLFVALDRGLNTKKASIINTQFAFFTAIVMIAGVVVTQSRNAIITLMIGIAFISIVTKNRKLILFLITMVSVLICTILVFYGQELDGIFAARIGDGAADIEGFNGRTSVWEIAILYFSQHPFQPVGYFGMIGEIGHTAHNVFLTTLIEQGIFGFLVYTFFTIASFSFCVKKIFDKYLSIIARRRLILYLISMFSILLQLQFEDSNLVGQHIIYYWIFLALMYLSAYVDLDIVDTTKPKYPDRNPQLVLPSSRKDTVNDSVLLLPKILL